MSSNISQKMKVTFWPDTELSRLFHTNGNGAVEALYQGSTDSELNILMTYEHGDVEQLYAIPLTHVLMYTIWEEDRMEAGNDSVANDRGA